MKYSIRKQLTVIFVGLIIGTILLCFLINSTLLEHYYITNKEDAFIEVYQTINEAADAGTFDTDEFDIAFQRICGKYNVNVVVLDENSVPVKASDNDPEILGRLLWDNLFGREQDGTILEKNDQYSIERQEDKRTHTDYIEMWGVLDNGNVFLMRSAVEGIKDSVQIANRFLIYTGLFAAALSVVVVYFVSRRITRPIMELAHISKQMCNLQFDVKYEGKSHTEVALLGENINQLSETLEKTISELKTANNELQKDIEKKNQIDEMRKEFLANVSHELKTPIALIQGYAEGLKEGITDDPESTGFYCDVIMDEAGKMNNMVKKLLTLNQLEAGNDVVSMERFDITALVHNYLQSADLLAKQNGISVHMDQTKEIYVWGDEFKIEEVLMNYFSNAVNHCEKEKVIEVKIEEMDGHARVSVFNTGMPIPEDSLPHLWEKFYKVDKARTREYGGSGIGLSIVKAIMESMNQKYGVINYENGVRFWFELELAGEESEITPAISEKNS